MELETGLSNIMKRKEKALGIPTCHFHNVSRNNVPSADPLHALAV
jgi:hypothetical protein